MVVDAVRRFFAERALAPRRVAVAASGGADSTALLLAMAESGFDVICVHVNHHLRGAESDGDEAFVRDLCARLGVELRVLDGTLDPEAIRDRGVEAAAREIRHARLHEVDADLIATAHQKNDQAETVLMRIASGSGVAGLRGIHPVREDGVVRPLLDVTRAEIEAFLKMRGVTPRRDSSNDDPRFLRNRVRKVAREIDIEKVVEIAEQAQQLWPAIETLLDKAERLYATVTADELHIREWPEDPWLAQALLHRHIFRIEPDGAREVSAKDLERLVTNRKGATVTKHLELIERNGEWILRRHPQPAEDFEVELEAGTTVRIPTTISAKQRFQLPKGAAPRFILRNRRAGDRFHPLGLPSDKKLKDFLIGRKIPAEVRDRIPLLIWNGEIVWVAGVEISERFKVTSPAGVLYDVQMEGAGGVASLVEAETQEGS